MAQYLFSVWHIGAYPTPSEEEMAAMFAAVGAFNDKMRDAGALVFGCGIDDPAPSVIVDGTGAEPTTRPGRFAAGPEIRAAEANTVIESISDHFDRRSWDDPSVGEVLEGFHTVRESIGDHGPAQPLR